MTRCALFHEIGLLMCQRTITLTTLIALKRGIRRRELLRCCSIVAQWLYEWDKL